MLLENQELDYKSSKEASTNLFDPWLQKLCDKGHILHCMAIYKFYMQHPDYTDRVVEAYQACWGRSANKKEELAQCVAVAAELWKQKTAEVKEVIEKERGL